jgi:hypothetical protein
VLLALLGVLLSVGWEVAELTSDALIGTDMSLSARDTRLDLLADFVGVLAAVAILFRSGFAPDRPRRRPS